MSDKNIGVLFYVDPYIELGRPDFRLGAVKNQFAPLVSMFSEHGWSMDLISNAFVQESVSSAKLLGNSVRAHHFSDEELDSFSDSYQSFSYKFSKQVAPDDLAVASLSRAFDRVLDGRKPDVVVIWESASSFMRHLYPDALILNLTPGLFSRSPMPDMVSLDVLGFFSESILGAGKHNKLVETVGEADLLFCKSVSSRYFDDLIFKNAPISRADLDPQSKFKKLVLVPLQVSNYFAFDAYCSYKNQFDFMVDVLRNSDPEVGVVVTQYVTGFVSDTPITAQNYGYLKQKFPNLIFDSRFNTIDSISQSLMPFVDAVVTVSSSIGLQAALMGKPVMSPSNSHVSALNAFSGLKEFFDGSDFWSGSLDSRQKICAMLLKHMHFVKTDTIFNPQWMIPSIEKALSVKRSGGGVLRVQSCFDASGDEYRNLFLTERSREQSYLGVLERAGMASRSIVSAAKHELEKRVKDPKISVVSFDIFDTLVQRVLERPVDVFTLMESFVGELTSGRVQSFGKTRYLAEKMARTRKTSLNPESNEVTLEEIYEVFVSSGDMSIEQARAAMDEELRLERKFLIRKEDGINLLNAAKAAGKRVVIISDMYLPKEFLTSMLSGLGVSGYDDFYVSRDYDVRKHDGRLFDVVAQDLGIESGPAWLHIGDNQVSDIDMAKVRGISTMKVVRGPENLMRSKKYADLYLKTRGERTIWDSIQLGLIAKEFHADTAGKVYLDTHFSGSPYQLGYAGMGPLLSGFAIWLARKALADGVSDLYFLARDGDVMKRVFDVIAPSIAPSIKTHYIYSSRRAAQVAGIDSAEAIMRMCATQFHGADLGTFLYEKFGLASSAVDANVLAAHGFALSDRIVRQDLMGRVLDLCLDLSEAIFAQSKCERDNYLSYLRAHGVDSAKVIGLVDIGYAGSMQQSLSQMLGRSNIHGYYFMSFSKASAVSAAGNPVRGFFGDFIEKQTSKHPIASLGLCFEMLFTNCDGSLVRFDADPKTGRVTPVFDNAAIELKRRTLLPVVQTGAVAFAADVTRYFGNHLSVIEFDPQSTLRVFVDFLEHPGGRDAEMLEGWKFEDSFSGVGVRYAVPPRGEIAKNPKVVERAVWRQGAAVFSRRTDIFDGKKNLSSTTQRALSIDSAGRSGDRNGFVLWIAKFFLDKKKLRKFERDPIGFWRDSSFSRWRYTKRIFALISGRNFSGKN